jgi:hypothetical protein
VKSLIDGTAPHHQWSMTCLRPPITGMTRNKIPVKSHKMRYVTNKMRHITSFIKARNEAQLIPIAVNSLMADRNRMTVISIRVRQSSSQRFPK